jgi:hypothetical protein
MMPRAVAFPRRLPHPARIVGLLVAALPGGCFSTETQARYPEDLYHPDYVKRTKAVAQFAEQRDRSQLPEAFELLLDGDGSIRLVAYSTIRQMSPGAEDFGYRPYLPQDVRYGIVVRWQAWWVKNGGEAPVTAEAGGGGAPGAAEAEGAAEAPVPGATEAAHG